MTGVTLSTAGFYSRSQAAMSRLSSDADRLTTQVSTGKRLLAPSDDSVAWSRLQGIARATADGGVDAANTKLATSVLAQADTTLGQIGERVDRASALFIQGNNATLTPAARGAIATELQGILDTIVGLANAKDVRGQPLFGGADGTAATLADGALVFAEGRAAAIPIGEGQSVEVTAPASGFLRAGDTDVAQAIGAMIAALQSGEAPPAEAGDALKAIGDQATATQASLGARAARVELVAAQLTDAAVDRKASQNDLEAVDMTQAITDLQKTMTVLQATQASFSKLSSLSLFDYLR